MIIKYIIKDSYTALRNIDLNMSKSLLLNSSYDRKTAFIKRMQNILYESLAIVAAEHSLWRKECYFICERQCAIKKRYFTPAEITASQ